MTTTLVLVAVALIAGLVIAGPVIGFKIALDYLFDRFCAHVPHTEDDVTAWDRALQDGHLATTVTVWRHLFRLDRADDEAEQVQA